MENNYNINDQIKAQKVNLVLSDGTMNEAVELSQALKVAEEEGLDVVEVSSKGAGGLPVCKVLDYGKLMYQQSKKKKSQKQIQHMKEIKYGFNIDAHDLQVKHKKIHKFLSKHYTVRYVLELKGREKHRVEEAFEKINENLGEFEDIATWKIPKISMGGNRASISTTLTPKHVLS